MLFRSETTSMAMNVPRKIVILKREKELVLDGDPPLFRKNVVSKLVESIEPKLKCPNALRYFFLVEGGAPRATHCLKHLSALAVGDSMWRVKSHLDSIASLLRWLRSPWIWPVIRRHAIAILRSYFFESGVLEAGPGFPETDSMHSKVGSLGAGSGHALP